MHLAIDTEFVWERTYYARLGLVQVASTDAYDRLSLPDAPPVVLPFDPQHEAQRAVRLIDPLLTDGAGIAEAVSNPAVMKILHDAVQDLQHLCRWCGASPTHLFDTRLAAGFCGFSATLSLRQLLMDTVGVELPKTQTRTDWTRRPLSGEQLLYAADDVAYMEAVVEILQTRARQFGTWEWMMEEMRGLDDPSRYAEDPVEDAWRRMKVPVSAFKTARQVLRLVALSAWREATARERDLPRNWVVADNVLVNAALNPPVGGRLPPSELPRPFAQAFFETLEVAEALPETGAPVLSPSASTQERDRATAVLAVIRPIAVAAHIDPVLFGSRGSITAFCQNPDDADHPLNQGWRRELLGSRARNAV